MARSPTRCLAHSDSVVDLLFEQQGGPHQLLGIGEHGFVAGEFDQGGVISRAASTVTVPGMP
jgi:hypothetical protein